MTLAPPPGGRGPTTRIDCDVTGGYNVKPGAFTYDYCPFCGHPPLEGDEHVVSVTLPG